VGLRVRSHGAPDAVTQDRMTQDRATSEARPSARPPWVGGAAIVLAVLTLVGAVRAFRPTSDDAPLPPMAGTSDTLRFRADAWFLPDDDLLGFVAIPTGPFLMGSDPALDSLAYDNEHWVETGGRAIVELPLFYIGRYEVTVAQFRAFVEATGQRADPAAVSGVADHPVVAVSWTDALNYARWLEGELLESPETPAELAVLLEQGWRVNVPTEAEWEKAARGTDGRIYTWGDEPRRDRANFLSGGTRPVGSVPCPECPHGLADMSGNVWEWTRTPFRTAPYDGRGSPTDLGEDALWVMRGGSFEDSEQNVRTGVRGGGDPGARRPFIGFRLAISRP
jgi:formylglycine-generating enzyme required for sulfatase activity